MPNVVTNATVRAQVKTRLGEADLTKVIAREEAYLARRIGPLAGARTLRFRRPAYFDSAWAIRLPRPSLAADVDITDNGTAWVDGDFRLGGGGYILEPEGIRSFNGPVDVAFTPSDALEVERVVIELVRLAVTETGYSSETIGGYTYQRGLDTVIRTRGFLVKSLKPKPQPQSIPLVSAYSRLRDYDPRVNHNIP